MENNNEAKINTNLRNAENTPSFWDTWKGVPDQALAHLTDDIYAYEAENNAFGKGIAIKYGDKNFWYSPSEKALFNSANTRITSEGMRSIGDSVMPEQINRLIEQALQNQEKNDVVS
jgi:hypothetical protein